jgi:hypothetical protein
MYKRFLLYAILCLAPVAVYAEDSTQVAPEWFGLNHLGEYLGLKPQDVSFRRDYTEPDSFRLEVVAGLMEHPLGMMDYARELKDAAARRQPEILAGILQSDLETEYQEQRTGPYSPSIEEVKSRYALYYTNTVLNELLTRAANYIDVIIPRSSDMMLARLSTEQKQFLTNQFKELLVTSVEEEFMSAEALDSLEDLEENYADQFVSFGKNIDKDPLVAAGVDCLQEVMLEIRVLRRKLSEGEFTLEDLLTSTEYLPSETDPDSYLGKQSGWRIGGTGNDYYDGDYKFILDLGGDDIYDLRYDPSNPHAVIIIDLSGDDHYRAKSDFALGSGCLSVGFLIDFAGNDRYDGKSFSCGSGFFGFGLLYDADGDDRYDGDTHVQGAASFGLGMLVDEGGRDIYNAALNGQGFGFTEGIGLIYETGGSDTYYAGGKYKDHLRYEDHYLSLSQGFGYGLRPWMSGGVGAIIDLTGNDLYYGDIFAQACSYWWSLGVIYDSSGNDNYQCFQYGQGAATHMTLGVLIEDEGNDVYFGKGLMQGCGHDYSCGLLLDRAGNDTYTAYDLSQAAGSANGVGIQIDNSGDDRYFVKSTTNTQGYGNPRRDFGSIGLFIDLGGSDQYSGNGRDNFYWKTDSRWGGGMDIEMEPPDTTESEDD